MMTSSDNEILVKILDGQGQILLRLDSLEAGQRVIVKRLDAVEAEQAAMKSELKAQRETLTSQGEDLNTFHAEFTKFKTETGTQFNGLFYEQRLQQQKTDMLQTSVNWVLGAIAVFATVLGALPSIREWVKKPEPQHHTLTDYELDEVARRVERRLSFK